MKCSARALTAQKHVACGGTSRNTMRWTALQATSNRSWVVKKPFGDLRTCLKKRGPQYKGAEARGEEVRTDSVPPFIGWRERHRVEVPPRPDGSLLRLVSPCPKLPGAVDHRLEEGSAIRGNGANDRWYLKFGFMAFQQSRSIDRRFAQEEERIRGGSVFHFVKSSDNYWAAAGQSLERRNRTSCQSEVDVIHAASLGS